MRPKRDAVHACAPRLYVAIHLVPPQMVRVLATAVLGMGCRLAQRHHAAHRMAQPREIVPVESVGCLEETVSVALVVVAVRVAPIAVAVPAPREGPDGVIAREAAARNPDSAQG